MHKYFRTNCTFVRTSVCASEQKYARTEKLLDLYVRMY
nr:MAG TPA: hypothetical protein [Caudoviricetes sp.]